MARLVARTQTVQAQAGQTAVIPTGLVTMHRTRVHREHAERDQTAVQTAERAELHTVPETPFTPLPVVVVVVVVATPQGRTDHREHQAPVVSVAPVVRREPESSG